MEQSSVSSRSEPNTTPVESNNSFTSLTSFSTVATTAISVDHGSHAQQSALPLLSVHSHDGSTSTFGATAQFAFQDHGHAQPASLLMRNTLSGEPISEVDLGFKSHDEHPSNVTTIEPSSKLVPKPCTVSQTGGLIVTSADGKRQCGCEEKALATAEFKKQIVGEGEAPLLKGLVASAAECVPCQSGLLGGPSFRASHLFVAASIAFPDVGSRPPIRFVVPSEIRCCDR